MAWTRPAMVSLACRWTPEDNYQRTFVGLTTMPSEYPTLPNGLSVLLLPEATNIRLVHAWKLAYDVFTDCLLPLHWQVQFSIFPLTDRIIVQTVSAMGHSSACAKIWTCLIDTFTMLKSEDIEINLSADIDFLSVIDAIHANNTCRVGPQWVCA